MTKYYEIHYLSDYTFTKVVFMIFQVITSHKLPDTEIRVILDACWTSLEESRRHPQYWQTLTAVVQTVYQPCLVMMSESELIVQKLNRVMPYLLLNVWVLDALQFYVLFNSILVVSG